MKKLSSVLIISLIVVVTLIATKDMLLKFSIEKGTQVATGLKLEIESMKLGLLKTFVDIKGIKLNNPDGFQDKVMLDMPVIYVRYDLGSFFKGKIHIQEIDINLAGFVVETNKDGKLNIDSLKMAKTETKEDAKPAKEKKETKPMKMQIDNLKLKVGKVVYKDYSKGTKEPSIQEFKINLDEEHKNISDLSGLVSLVVVKALAKTTIAKLTDFDLKGLQSSLSEGLSASTKLIEGGASELSGAAKQLAGGTTDAVNDTVKSLENVFKLPFGEEKKEQ